MQFRSAYIAVVVLASSLVIADDNLDESKAIGKLELLGGSVTRNDKLPGRPVVGVELHTSKNFSDKDMRLLFAFPNLEGLSLNSQITDVGLIEIGGHKNLTDLRVNNGYCPANLVVRPVFLKTSGPRARITITSHAALARSYWRAQTGG